MDTLVNISYVQKQMYELPNMYQKILETVNFYSVVEYVKSLNKLFKETIVPHFELEEREVFPLALSREELGLRGLVSELLQEHRQINEKLARLNELSSKPDFIPKASQGEKDQLTAFCTEITRQLAEHAQKEDAKFYPFLKDIILGSK